MSFHILHIFHHGAVLGKEHGFITWKVDKKEVGRIPHEDLRAVIIAARGVKLTSNFVSAVLETNGVILHCNESYEPCGITAPLARVVDTKAYLNQIARPKALNTRLWNRLLRGKTLNQSRVLGKMDKQSPHLERVESKRAHTGDDETPLGYICVRDVDPR